MELSDTKKEQTKSVVEILQPDEWEAYKAIRLKALQTDPAAFGVSYEQEAAQSDEAWQQKLAAPGRRMYAAKVGERIAAITGVRFETAAHVDHLATLIAVFTDPDFRNQGIGTKLFEKILADLRENQKVVKVRLSVNNTNEAAKNFYEKVGFEQVGLARKEMRVNGQYYDQAQMELIFEDKL